MTIAGKVLSTLTERESSAYSLGAGYAVGPLNRGRFTFPTGALLSERRNDAGRVTHALYAYADGSRLEFTWTAATGPALREMRPGQALSGQR